MAGTDGRAANIATIPADMPFLETLARRILNEHGRDPAMLGRVTILLPTRRAARALGECFSALLGGPALLPAMRPIGDVEEEDLALSALAAGLEFAVEPSIAPLRRQLLLAMMIRAGGAVADEPVQSMRLARELAGLIDQIHTERLEFSALAGLVPEDLAAHWQLTLEFLTVITEHWPRILAEEGCIDPARRRDRLQAMLADLWRRRPPQDPVYAAGSTGSLPGTAELLEVVASLPRGQVVLPGLDTAMEDAVWEEVRHTPTHPQHGMALLLERLKVGRGQVRVLTGEARGNPGRLKLLNDALLPAGATAVWRDLPPYGEEALAGIRRIDCTTPAQEAAVIALLIREALEEPEKTVGFITPDRALARRVCVELRRFSLEVEDSAGTPLDNTPPGIFVRQVAAALAGAFSPVALLAALKHPMAAAGVSRAQCRHFVRTGELRALRVQNPARNLADIAARLEDEEAAGFWRRIDEVFSTAAQQINGASAFAVQLRALLDLCMVLSENDKGEVLLWQGTAGEEIYRFFTDLLTAADGASPIDAARIGEYIGVMMSSRAVRSPYRSHPRLDILGPIEARLYSADRVILGGLNEGSWPPEAHADAWLNRPMRKDYGLPLPERRIGLSAHDFVQLAARGEVFLTRAEKQGGTPTVPARWLVRLETLLSGKGQHLAPAENYIRWVEALERAKPAPRLPRPAPCPPVASRPRRLSVTRIETLLRDPYAIYAEKILRLRPLEPLEQPIDQRIRGIVIHRALENFAAYMATHPEEAPLPVLLQAGQEVFAAVGDPAVLAFWWPRFQRAARAYIEKIWRREDVLRRYPECRGALEIEAPAGPFLLTAKADRIDRLKEGGYAIVDFKTGQPPSEKQVRAGLSPQLTLEALILKAGGFEGVPAGESVCLSYIAFADPPKRRDIVEDLPDLLRETERNLFGLLSRYDDPATCYPSRILVEKSSFAGDYDHLARLREWSADGGGE